MRKASILVVAGSASIALLAVSPGLAASPIAAPAFSLAHPVAATDTGVTVDHVWARATAGGATTGAIYLTVGSKAAADHLTGASTPVAAMAELHETTNDNGVMKMRPVTSIALDPGKPVTFQPGGYHVMLMGLKAPLKVGQTFPLTLTFEHAAAVTVTATVQAAGGTGSMPGMGNMPGMGSMSGMHNQ